MLDVGGSCWGRGGVLGRRPTFLAVVLVVVQHEAAAALALVAAEGVEALVLAAPVVLGALVLVCRERAEAPWLSGGGTPRHPSTASRHGPAAPQPHTAARRGATSQASAYGQQQADLPSPAPAGAAPMGAGRGGSSSPWAYNGDNHYLLMVRTGKAEKHTVTTKDAQERPGRGSPSLLIDREMSQTW